MRFCYYISFHRKKYMKFHCIKKRQSNLFFSTHSNSLFSFIPSNKTFFPSCLLPPHHPQHGWMPTTDPYIHHLSAISSRIWLWNEVQLLLEMTMGWLFEVSLLSFLWSWTPQDNWTAAKEKAQKSCTQLNFQKLIKKITTFLSQESIHDLHYTHYYYDHNCIFLTLWYVTTSLINATTHI